MKDLNKNKILAQLHKEFRKLEKGKTVQINFTPQLDKITIPLKLRWEEADYAQYSWNEDLFRKYKTILFNDIEEALDNEASEYTGEIHKFLDKCNSFAKQFDEDKDSFWDQVYRFGRDKEQKIKNIKYVKKQIKEKEGQINHLKQDLLVLKKTSIRG